MTTCPGAGPLTRADLDAMPDDNHRYELIDGVLLVTPAGDTSGRRSNSVWPPSRSLPPGLEILHRFDVVLADDTVLQRRYRRAARGPGTEKNLPTRCPVPAVEIPRPAPGESTCCSSVRVSRRPGAPAYWVVDPDVPSIIAGTSWTGGMPRRAAEAPDVLVLDDVPYPVVTICPADLVRC